MPRRCRRKIGAVRGGGRMPWIWIAASLDGERGKGERHSEQRLENNHGPIFLAVV